MSLTSGGRRLGWTTGLALTAVLLGACSGAKPPAVVEQPPTSAAPASSAPAAQPASPAAAVPAYTQPTLGRANAPVTIIDFSDFL